MEWVTSQHSTDGETASLEDAEPDNRLASIIRTGRLESAGRSQQGRNSISVERKQREANRFHLTSPKRSANLGDQAWCAMLSSGPQTEVPTHLVWETPKERGLRSVPLAPASSTP